MPAILIWVLKEKEHDLVQKISNDFFLKLEAATGGVL